MVTRKSTRQMAPPSVAAQLNGLRGDPRISAYAAVAAEWGFPVWAMMIPETTRDMFEDRTRMDRLVVAMQDYLTCSDEDRRNIEGMAAGLAKLSVAGDFAPKPAPRHEGAQS